MRMPVIALPVALLLIACADTGDGEAGGDTGATSSAADTPGDTTLTTVAATAEMRDASGQALGRLALRNAEGGIGISGALAGLPAGEHALHLHQVGQCEPPFTSAGSHWNPTNRQHGSQNPQGPHLGDLPNITVPANDSVRIQATTPGGTLTGTNGLLDADGAAVVIHAGADDYRSDPAGNAGDRIACGVVQLQQ